MTFADLQAGDAVFVDANTLVYHFTAHATFGTACTQLLERIENQDLLGFTSTVALGEAMHRLMTTEASSRFGWPFAAASATVSGLIRPRSRSCTSFGGPPQIYSRVRSRSGRSLPPCS